MPKAIVLGAGTDRSKFGNKSLRAHRQAGYHVIALHPRDRDVEGAPTYPSLADLPEERYDRLTVYIPPAAFLALIPTIPVERFQEIWLNPGVDTPEVLAAAKEHGLPVIAGCSIVALGFSPSQFGE
jgi:predicted CoA-binding protein